MTTTEKRPDTGARPHVGALVHEKGTGGPTMFVKAAHTLEGWLVCSWRDDTGEPCVGAWPIEELVVVVPYTAENDR